MIVLALNIAELQTHFSDPTLCRKYPGAGFLPHLAQKTQALGIPILGAQDALTQVHYNQLSPKDLIVFQEELNPTGLDLIALGATPKLVFCLESKMYAPLFYDHLDSIKNIFKNTLLFESGTKPIHFPSYDEEELILDTTSPRKEICMISSNKQFWHHPTHFESPSWCSAIRNELHTARLKAIEEHPEMDLYGYGWDRLDNIPPHWAFLKPQIQRMWKGTTPNKIQTLSQYKSAICFENTSEPGYITEKMPHCWVAGTTPIYKGPPNTPSHYPPQAIPSILKKYSNESFAQTVLDLLI